MEWIYAYFAVGLFMMLVVIDDNRKNGKSLQSLGGWFFILMIIFCAIWPIPLIWQPIKNLSKLLLKERSFDRDED